MLLNCGIGENSLRVPWTARRSNQPILKEISPEYSLEGLMLKLKFQYFGHLMQRTDSLEWARLKAGREGEDRGWYGWMASLTQWTWVWASSGSRWWTGKPGVLQSMGLQSQTQATELNWNLSLKFMAVIWGNHHQRALLPARGAHMGVSRWWLTIRKLIALLVNMDSLTSFIFLLRKLRSREM